MVAVGLFVPRNANGATKVMTLNKDTNYLRASAPSNRPAPTAIAIEVIGFS